MSGNTTNTAISGSYNTTNAYTSGSYNTVTTQIANATFHTSNITTNPVVDTHGR